MQFAPVVLKDAAAVDHTFTPRDITSGVATFVESTGVPIADKRLTHAQSRVTATGRTKVTLKMTLPVVQDVVVNGISRPTVVRTAYADATFTFDASSNAAERNDLRILFEKAILGDLGVKLIGGLETLY